MVQGPWGCNQMIRNRVEGTHAISGQWGNAQLIPGGRGGPAITYVIAGAVVPMGHANPGFSYDHRLTGPYAPAISNAAIIRNGPMVCDSGLAGRGHGYYKDGRRRRSRHMSYYKYKFTDRPA